MNCKKSNITYLMFIAISLPIFIMIMSTAFTAGADKASQSIDYNKVIELKDYYVKISDAIYITDTDEITFTFNVKPKYDKTSSSLPKIEKVTTNLSYKTAKPIKLNSKKGAAQFYTVGKIEKDFTFFTVYFITKTPDQKTETKYDEFGAEIPGEVKKGETIEAFVRVDKKDMQCMTAAEKKTLVTTQPPVITTTSASVTAPYNYAARAKTTIKTSTKSTTTTSKSTSVSSTKKNSSQSNHEAAGGKSYGGGAYQGGDYYSPTQQENQNNDNDYEQPSQENIQTSQDVHTTAKQTTKAPSTSQEYIHVNAISLDTGFSNNNVKLSVGNSHMISAVVKPDNATNKAVTWESNRTDIATVDENGKITAISKGKAIITAKTKDGGLSASCMVTVS